MRPLFSADHRVVDAVGFALKSVRIQKIADSRHFDDKIVKTNVNRTTLRWFGIHPRIYLLYILNYILERVRRISIKAE